MTSSAQKPSNLDSALAHLADVVDQRRDAFAAGQADPKTSYTALLFSKGDDGILKKIGEEATEAVMAAKESINRAFEGGLSAGVMALDARIRIDREDLVAAPQRHGACRSAVLVGDEQRAALVPQAAEQRPQVTPQQRVEAHRRLVQQHPARVVYQSPRHQPPAAHPARGRRDLSGHHAVDAVPAGAVARGPAGQRHRLVVPGPG